MEGDQVKFNVKFNFMQLSNSIQLYLRWGIAVKSEQNHEHIFQQYKGMLQVYPSGILILILMIKKPQNQVILSMETSFCWNSLDKKLTSCCLLV